MPETQEAEAPALADPAKMTKAALLDELAHHLTAAGLKEVQGTKVADLRVLLGAYREKAAEAAEEPAEAVDGEVVEEADEAAGELVPATEAEVEDEVGKALALREQAIAATHALPTPAEYNVLGLLAHRTFNTTFVPTAYRGKEADVFAAFLFGREIGLGPMMALRDIYMIDGRPALAAHRQLAKLREAGVVILESEATRERAYIKARRRDTGEVMAVEFTWEEAQLIEYKTRGGGTARLVDKDNWKNYRADMLWARCLGRLTRRLGPDLTGGLPPYVAEEVADFSGWGVEYDESGAPKFDNVKRENEMQPPRTFAAVDAVVSHYGPTLGWREWLRDASELLFKTRDASELTVAQKTQLLQKASGACVALRNAHDPRSIPPINREDVQRAWAAVLDGITLPGPPWRMSPEEEDKPEYEHPADAQPVPKPEGQAPVETPAAAAEPAPEPQEGDDIPWPEDDPSGYGG